MTASRSGYRIGVDIGGTFTDAVLLCEATGGTRIAKVPSTPDDPSRGFLDAVDRILGLADVQPGDICYLVHGTTVATNALIEGKTPRTAFLTTGGFRDLLEIGRQVRPSLYDVHFEKPVYMVESGPAAGVIVSNHIAGGLGHRNAISFDMGGTTAKVGLILAAPPNITKEYEVGAQAAPGIGQARASGYPIRTPVIDLVEMRYCGQSHEFAVECPPGTLTRDEIEALRRRFHVEHDRSYGHGYPDEATEMVNFRLAALGSIAKPRLREIDPASGPASDAEKGTRPVWFGTAGDFVATPVYDRSRLAAEHRFEGPAIVEEMDSTTLVLPGYAVTVDRCGDLLISPASDST